jgi:poly-gamma-glutamate synthesis protein (capsule biosynthesis protein)
MQPFGKFFNIRLAVRIELARALAGVVVLLTVAAASGEGARRFPPVAGGNAALFNDAIARERPTQPRLPQVTGIAVPHHLLAADLIARGFWAASGGSYERIVIIGPDHFRRSQRPVATTRRGFDTVLGPVDVDREAADVLIGRPDLVDDSDLFQQEHAISAILPFVRAVFPGTPIVPLVLATGPDRRDWDAIVELLKQIVTPRTLVVQSTDYSHYLLPQVARERDQETLNIIAADSPAAVDKLHQSNHLDSKASQYVQMALQNEVFHSHAVVVANRNSYEYVHEDVPSTSYIVSVYAADGAALSRLVFPDQQIAYFGGDVFLGRLLTVPLLNKTSRQVLIDGVKRMTNGGPLVVNLEGVILPDPPVSFPSGRHVMDDALAGPVLHDINAIAAGLANNHGFDLGPDGLAASVKALNARSIQPLTHGAIADLGGFRLVALNFVGPQDVKGYPVVKRVDSRGGPAQAADITRLCNSPARPPLVALVHWGNEYTTSAGSTERNIAEELAGCGVSLVIGAHSHQASAGLNLAGGGEALMLYSLGNLLFDQASPRGSGALLELRVFGQGTFAARLIMAPNLYDAVARN